MTAGVAPDARRALIRAAVVGTILQVAMVVSGHLAPVVASLFAVGGMAFSLLAGLLYSLWRGRTKLGAMAGAGAVAGGVGAFLGILVSWALGDVPLTLLGFGTASSIAAGALGACVGRMFAR
jgi:hypothetical protein